MLLHAQLLLIDPFSTSTTNSLKAAGTSLELPGQGFPSNENRHDNGETSMLYATGMLPSLAEKLH